MLNKKGLSSVVATILIVLLTIVAVGVLASYIVPMFIGNLESTKCFNYRDSFDFEEEFGYNCHNGSLYAVSVQNKVSSEEKFQNIEGFKLVFVGGGEAKTVDIKEGDAKTGEIRMLNSSLSTLQVPKNGEVKTYVFTAPRAFDSAKIHPILKSGDICDESGSIKIDSICEYPVEIR